MPLTAPKCPPASHVWKNIERDLAFQESGKYRRGFIFYRAIAATLLLLIAGLSWYIISHQQEIDPTTLGEETKQVSPGSSADSGKAAVLSDEPMAHEGVTEERSASSPDDSDRNRSSQTAVAPSAKASRLTPDQPALAYQNPDAHPEDASAAALPSDIATTTPRTGGGFFEHRYSQ